MNPGRASTLALATMSVLAAAACGKVSSGGTAPAVASASAAPSASVPAAAQPSVAAAASASAGAPAPPHRPHVSLAGVLLRAAYELPLSDDQRKQLDGVDAKLYPAGAQSPWTAVAVFQADLVQGIRRTRLDMPKLKADETSVDKAVAAGEGAEALALNALHGALDAGARKALVDIVKGKLTGGARPPASAVDAGAVDWTQRRLEHVTNALGLDDAQQKQVAPLLARDASASSPASVTARHDAERRRLDVLLAEFPRDGFDARKLDLSGPAGKTPHDRLDQAAVFAAGLVPLLRMDQLARFAEQTERAGRHPEHILDDVDRVSTPVAAGDSHG